MSSPATRSTTTSMSSLPIVSRLVRRPAGWGHSLLKNLAHVLTGNTPGRLPEAPAPSSFTDSPAPRSRGVDPTGHDEVFPRSRARRSCRSARWSCRPPRSARARPCALIDHREQMPGRPVGSSRATHGLPVHREHPPRPTGSVAVHMRCTNPPITASNRSPSTRAITRRIVDSHGHRGRYPARQRPRRAGQRPTRRPPRTTATRRRPRTPPP